MGPMVSLGHNLDGDGSCGLAAPGDNTADPLLGPLADNGGATPTHALLPGSPAIDAGDDAACAPTDQRGQPRPADGNDDGTAACDIGAYELQLYRPVTIDIKPGSLINPINRTSRGKVPVAVLSAPDLDAPGWLDAGSLTFGRTGDEASFDGRHCGVEDVNGDGLPDLVCHFETPRMGFRAGDTHGVLKGSGHDGTPIRGQDAVKIVP